MLSLLANKEAQSKKEEAKILATLHTDNKLNVYEKIMIWKSGDKCINAKQSRKQVTLWQPFME